MFTPCEVIGGAPFWPFAGTGQKKSMAIRERMSGPGFVSWIFRMLPLAVTPRTGVLALPCASVAPTMSCKNGRDGDSIFGFASRSIAAL